MQMSLIMMDVTLVVVTGKFVIFVFCLFASSWYSFKYRSKRWRVNNVGATIDADSNENQMHLLTNLRPYTQYAIYVQTYSVALQQMGKRVGARSPILYERTSPAGK